MNIDLAQYGAAQFITLYAGLIVLGWLLALIVPAIRARQANRAARAISASSPRWRAANPAMPRR